MTSLLLDLGLELRGGQRQVYYLARALTAQETFKPLVACPRTSALAKLLAEEKIPVLPLPGRHPGNPLVLFTLLQALKQHSVVLIHTHDAHAATVGAWLKKWNKDLKLIHSRRVSYPLRRGWRSKKYILADAVVGVSAAISQELENVGIAPSRIRTIHSGIDPSRYRPQEKRQDGRFVFQSVGALTPQKGYSVLLKAMTVLWEMEDLPPWEVRIAGEGPLFQELLDEAFSLNVHSRLALLGRQDSRVVLPLCDVLLVPSTEGEGSSATIKEGWATGVPVICSALPSNTELVEDKHNGLVAPVGNPLALAAAMARCMNEPALRQRLVANGHESILRFTDTRMAEAYMELYHSLFPLS